MAVRLSVVMIHSPPASASAGQLSEAIVGELIGMPQIDMTLIGPIAQLSEGSTDRLTLESLSGDVAVLDWQSPEELIQSLAEIGFDGQRAPHSDDPDVQLADRSARRIYAFDLNQYRDAKVLARSVLHLKSSRQVRTFSLAPGPSPSQTSGGRATPVADNGRTKAAPSPSPQPADAQEASLGTQTDKIPTQSDSTLDLDDLLNRLDELDP